MLDAVNSASPPIATRRHYGVASCLLLFGSILFSYLSIRNNALGLLSDSYIYLLLADYFSPFYRLDRDFAEYLLTNYAYPPGFPILLGVLGGGSERFPLNYAIDAIFLAATISAFYFWLLAQGMKSFFALGFCVLFAMLPGTLISSLGIFSEHPYMLLIGLAMLLVSMKPTLKRLLLAAALIGLAALIRTVGIAAILAFMVWIFANRRVIKLGQPAKVAVLILAIAPTVFWGVIKSISGYSTSYTESLVAGNIAKTIENLIHQVLINGRAFSQHFSALLSGEASNTQIAVAALMIFVATGLLVRLKGKHFDAYYVTIYLSVIFVWPYPDHFARFIFVILPYLLFYAFAAFQLILACALPGAKKLLPEKIASLLFLLAIVALAYPASTLMLHEVVINSNSELVDYVRTPMWHLDRTGTRKAEKIGHLASILESLERVRTHTPEDACVSSPEPHFVHFFARRRSTKPASKQAGDELFEQQLVTCPYVFMMAVASTPPSGYPPMYPFYRIQQRMRVLDAEFFEDRTKSGTVRSMLSEVVESKMRHEQQ
ncbi:MAG: hypothetical protein AAF387_02935 [Pseudomonadota bacterium]